MMKFCTTTHQLLNLTGGSSSMITKSSFVRALFLFNLRGQLEKPVPGQQLRSIHFRFISQHFHEMMFLNCCCKHQTLHWLIIFLQEDRAEALSDLIVVVLLWYHGDNRAQTFLPLNPKLHQHVLSSEKTFKLALIRAFKSNAFLWKCSEQVSPTKSWGGLFLIYRNL